MVGTMFFFLLPEKRVPIYQIAAFLVLMLPFIVSLMYGSQEVDSRVFIWSALLTPSSVVVHLILYFIGVKDGQS